VSAGKEDWDDLAAKVLDPSTPPDVREQAAGRVRERLERMARRVCKQYGLDPEHCWADEVVSDTLKQCFYDDDPNKRYDPSRGHFLPFARTLIQRKIVDRLRQEQKQRQITKELGNRKRSESAEADLPFPPGWYFQEPFSQAELEMIEQQWQPPRDRVIVAVCFGIHGKVPAQRWSRWLREAQIDPSFPPPELDHAGPQHGIQTRVAEHLGINPATVAQLVKRKGKGWLAGLPSIQDLRGYRS